MKRFLLLFNLILTFAVVNAQETYRFRTDAPQGLKVTSSTASHVSLHYSIQELGVANIVNGEVKGQEIILKGQFGPNAVGRPNLPVVNRYVAVPQGATVSMQVRENASTVLNNIDLLPAMPAQYDLDDKDVKLRWDADVFGKDANYPTENTYVSAPTQIRKLDVVMLSVTPFRYNPVKKTLEVIYDIDIDIQFEGGNGQFGESRYLSPDWEHILRNLVVNPDMIPTTDYYSMVKEARDRNDDGWEYLIIAPDDSNILAWADTLKAFRTKQGISTKIATVSECGGNNANSIRNYILNAYNNWAVPPAAVLIFGGYRNGTGIRPFYHVTVADSSYNARTYPTDYPYCDMNGDSLADMAISRVSARNVNEYRIYVQKTIQYETNPSTDPNYYDRPIFSTGHEANKWFLIGSQTINAFLRDKIGKHPTNLYMLQSGSIPTSTWSTGYNASVLVDYFGPNGQNYIPETPSYLDDWVSNNDSILLYDALNEGAFLTMYRDHSHYNGWWNPKFKSQYIEPMLYGPPTFVLSISCSTIKFDESGRSLIDAFCIKEGSGAVGGIGAASLTHSYFNDILAWGFFDCIWPSFLPDQGSNTAPEFVRPSFALAEAKHYYGYHVFLQPWWTDVDQSQMNLFGYIGETYLNLYTETPQPIDITHELYHQISDHEFTVTAEAGAIVCLELDGQIIGVVKSDGQPCTFTLPMIEVGKHFTVTATKQNHFRYECQVTIIPGNVPYVAIERDGLLVQNPYGFLHNSENAQIGLKLHNYGSSNAANVTMSLSCDSPYIDITQGTHQHQNIGANQTVTINNAFRFTIADDIPDMTEVTFTIHIEDGGSGKNFNIKQNIAAPLFVIKPYITYKDEDQQTILQLVDEGGTDIHIQIANEGHFGSGPFIVQLKMQAPFITPETASYTFNALDKGSTNEIVFRVNAAQNEIGEGWIHTIIHASDGIREAALETDLPYGGFNESFDPSCFNSHNWQMWGDADWYLTNAVFHSSVHSARSGSVTHNQSSITTITRNIQKATEISFYRKLSSETNYDKLHFYIDNEDLAAWSGNLSWKEATFPVSPGNHTFKWSYIKDVSVNSGQDCAWIDDINILPAHNLIASSGGTLTACANESVHIDCNYAYDYRSFVWSTDGDGSFDDATAVHPIYTPGPNDVNNGGTTLQMHVDNAFYPLQLVLSNNLNLGSIQGDDWIDPVMTSISHYSVTGANGLNYIWQLEPAEAGYIVGQGNAIDIVWNFRLGMSEATLTVTSEASCVEGAIEKTIQFDTSSLTEESGSGFTLFPNPTDGEVNLVVGQDLDGKTVVEVYNMMGMRLMEKDVRDLTKGQSLTLNFQHYSPGIYIIKLCNGEGCWSQKVSVR